MLWANSTAEPWQQLRNSNGPKDWRLANDSSLRLRKPTARDSGNHCTRKVHTRKKQGVRENYVVDASARGPDYAKRDSLASNNGCHVEVMCLGSIWDEVRERFLAWQHVEDHVCTLFSPTEGFYKPWAAGDITFTRRC